MKYEWHHSYSSISGVWGNHLKSRILVRYRRSCRSAWAGYIPNLWTAYMCRETLLQTTDAICCYISILVIPLCLVVIFGQYGGFLMTISKPSSRVVFSFQTIKNDKYHTFPTLPLAVHGAHEVLYKQGTIECCIRDFLFCNNSFFRTLCAALYYPFMLIHTFGVKPASKPLDARVLCPQPSFSPTPLSVRYL